MKILSPWGSISAFTACAVPCATRWSVCEFCSVLSLRQRNHQSIEKWTPKENVKYVKNLKVFCFFKILRVPILRIMRAQSHKPLSAAIFYVFREATEQTWGMPRWSQCDRFEASLGRIQLHWPYQRSNNQNCLTFSHLPIPLVASSRLHSWRGNFWKQIR